jgi:hypothetical protein
VEYVPVANNELGLSPSKGPSMVPPVQPERTESLIKRNWIKY